MSINRVVLVGRLTRDPEVRVTTTGRNVANFSIAVDRRFKSEGEQETDFVRIVAWRQQADFISQYGSKGRLVAVDGRLQIRTYEDNSGQKRESAEVVADNLQLLDRPKDGGGGARETAPLADEEDPFANE